MISTVDMWLATWLVFKGFELSDYKILNGKKVEYFFTMSQEEMKKQRIEFMNSAQHKFVECNRKVKDCGY